MLGHRQRNALTGGRREDSSAELGAHARIGAKHRRGSGEDSDELRNRASGRLNALQDRSAVVGCCQLVVDLESADFCLDRHFLILLPWIRGRLFVVNASRVWRPCFTFCLLLTRSKSTLSSGVFQALAEPVVYPLLRALNRLRFTPITYLLAA